MHINDNFLRHLGIVMYFNTERLIIESLISDDGIDFSVSIHQRLTIRRINILIFYVNKRSCL